MTRALHQSAMDLVCAVAENPLAGGADKNEASAFVDHADGVEQQIDKVFGRRVGAGFHAFTVCRCVMTVYRAAYWRFGSMPLALTIPARR